MLTKGDKQQFKTQCLFGSQPMINTGTRQQTASKAALVGPSKSSVSTTASMSLRTAPRASATQMMSMNYMASSQHEIPQFQNGISGNQSAKYLNKYQTGQKTHNISPMMGREQNANARFPAQNLKKDVPFGIQSNMISKTAQRTSALKMMAKDFEVSGKTGDDHVETEFYEEYFTDNEREVEHRRVPVVGGNWKSNGDRKFIEDYSNNVLNKTSWDTNMLTVCVAPTCIHLNELNKATKDEYKIMAQTVSQFPSGAFTGNITAHMMKDFGINWAMTGHSERRTKCGSTDQQVALKTNVAIQNDMMVMVCIGEGLEEREMGKADAICARQLQAIADELERYQWGNVVIAYEPVWAIGTGKVATADQAQETHANIRKWLKTHVGPDVADHTRILYGGSVNAKNCAELIKQQDIDGFLVGGASMTPDFKSIIETVNGWSVEQTI